MLLAARNMRFVGLEKNSKRTRSFFFNHVAFASLRHVNTDSGATQIDDLDAGRPPVDGSSGLRFLMHAGRRYDRGVGSLMTHNEMLSSHSMMLR